MREGAPKPGNPTAEAFDGLWLISKGGGGPRPVTVFISTGARIGELMMHMGASGPTPIVTANDAHKPPRRIPRSTRIELLDATDLVFFIDATGTGFSRQSPARTRRRRSSASIRSDLPSPIHLPVPFLLPSFRRIWPREFTKYMFGKVTATPRSVVLVKAASGPCDDFNA